MAFLDSTLCLYSSVPEIVQEEQLPTEKPLLETDVEMLMLFAISSLV